MTLHLDHVLLLKGLNRLALEASCVRLSNDGSFAAMLQTFSPLLLYLLFRIAVLDLAILHIFPHPLQCFHRVNLRIPSEAKGPNPVATPMAVHQIWACQCSANSDCNILTDESVNPKINCKSAIVHGCS